MKKDSPADIAVQSGSSFYKAGVQRGYGEA